MQRETDRNERYSRWTVYYRYSSQQQYEQYHANVLREKRLKRERNEFVKAKRLKNGKERPQQKRKEYKLPLVEEQEINIAKQEILSDGSHGNQEYIQFDLKRNRWITVFLTVYECRLSQKHHLLKIGAYTLFVAVDEEDKERGLFGVQQEDKYKTTKKDKGSKRDKTAETNGERGRETK